MNNDSLYMERCLQLAGIAAGSVAPNPMVGAVLVYENRIIGEGFHQLYGQAHAEANCIRDAEKEYKDLVSRSTLYVSLEPCAHFGKTPPCADLIIEKKIPRVVVGCRDPFEAVNGKGIEKLKMAGIEVVQNVLEASCKTLNKRFFTFHTKRRPYIILKWAQTTDSIIGSEEDERLMITNEITNRLVHKWRAEEAAILVGTNTALLDNPSLTTRLWKGKNPLRIVVDKTLRLPGTLDLLSDGGKTIVLNDRLQEEKGPVTFYKLPPMQNDVSSIIEALYQLNIQSVLIEGGRKLLQSFINENFWDEVRMITNSATAGNGVSAPQLHHAICTGSEVFLSDTIRFYKPTES